MRRPIDALFALRPLRLAVAGLALAAAVASGPLAAPAAAPARSVVVALRLPLDAHGAGGGQGAQGQAWGQRPQGDQGAPGNQGSRAPAGADGPVGGQGAGSPGQDGSQPGQSGGPPGGGRGPVGGQSQPSGQGSHGGGPGGGQGHADGGEDRGGHGHGGSESSERRQGSGWGRGGADRAAGSQPAANAAPSGAPHAGPPAPAQRGPTPARPQGTQTIASSGRRADEPGASGLDDRRGRERHGRGEGGAAHKGEGLADGNGESASSSQGAGGLLESDGQKARSAGVGRSRSEVSGVGASAAGDSLAGLGVGAGPSRAGTAGSGADGSDAATTGTEPAAGGPPVAPGAAAAAPAVASSPLTASLVDAVPSALLATGVAQPASAVAARGGARRGRFAGASTGGTSAGIAPLALASSAAAASSARSATPVRTSSSRDPDRRRPSRSRSPLVTTITKIVGVVPTPIRILLAALVALALAFGIRSRLTALRARRLERQRAELLEDVGLLQGALLPLAPARLGPVGTSTAYRPADGPGAGGDFYDVFALEDGQIAVVLGDVSGHGRQALPHTALVRFTLRAYLEAGLPPRIAVQTAGTVLERQLGGSFATVVAATYNPRERLLRYSCAGHPPPLLLGSRRLSPVTAAAAPPIGVGLRTGTRQTVVAVPGAARICFHTDGLPEARVGGELFGGERLARALEDLGEGATAAALLERVAELTDARPDDMAACLLNVEGGDEAPVLVSEEIELDREEATAARTERLLTAYGVDPEAAIELMASAQAAAGRAGPAVLELRVRDGVPHAAVRRENVALLHPIPTVQPTGIGASR